MATHHQQQPSLERVTYKPRIVSLLQQIQESRSVLSVHLPNDQSRYTSAILAIHSDSDALLIDELNPARGHERLVKSRELNISARLSGINIYFKSQLLEVQTDGGIAIYKLPIPERLLYEQRRGAFRVRVGAGITIPFTLLHEETKLTYDGQLSDVSSIGIGATLGAIDQLNDNVKGYSCRIHASDKEVITADLEVRFVKFDDTIKLLRVGGAFLHLTAPQRTQIDRFVMTLQREIIKRSRDK